MFGDPTLFVRQIIELQASAVGRWHGNVLDNPFEGLLGVVCQQHQYNFLLWHQEDIARSPDVGEARIAEVKWAIDGYNQQRNDWIEKIDEALLKEIGRCGVLLNCDARSNSETPGSVIDRLSILSIRLYHLGEQLDRQDVSSEHLTSVQTKLDICREQHVDLSGSLAELLDDIFSGRKRLKLYRQMKMYNDPALNPYLYRGQQRRAG